MFFIIVTTFVGHVVTHDRLPRFYPTMDACGAAATEMARAYTPQTNEMKSWGCVKTSEREA